MPAQSTIAIRPPQVQDEQRGYSQQMTVSAKPAAKATAHGGGLSESDKAALALSGEITLRLGEYSDELVDLAPDADAEAASGLQKMEQTDGDNARELQQLGQRAEAMFGRSV